MKALLASSDGCALAASEGRSRAGKIRVPPPMPDEGPTPELIPAPHERPRPSLSRAPRGGPRPSLSPRTMEGRDRACPAHRVEGRDRACPAHRMKGRDRTCPARGLKARFRRFLSHAGERRRVGRLIARNRGCPFVALVEPRGVEGLERASSEAMAKHGTEAGVETSDDDVGGDAVSERALMGLARLGCRWKGRLRAGVKAADRGVGLWRPRPGGGWPGWWPGWLSR